jgi:predicted kinase
MFTMLIGIPGSGKSTWLKNQDDLQYVVCPDSIRDWLTGDISNQTQNDVVWKIALHTTLWAICNSLDVTLDATNVNTSLRRDFLYKLPLSR